MKLLFKFILAMCMVLMTAIPSFSGSVSSTAVITVNYSAACSIDNSSLTLNYNGTDASSSMNVTTTCSNGASWTLNADSGLHPSSTLRRVQSGSNYMSYRMYKDAASTQEITLSSATVATGVGTGTVQTTPVYVSILASDNAGASIGTYTDTVTFTLVF